MNEKKNKKKHIKCSEIAKRQNTDENFGKTECVNRSWLSIFLTAEFCGKRAKLSKLEKTAQKKGAIVL